MKTNKTNTGHRKRRKATKKDESTLLDEEGNLKAFERLPADPWEIATYLRLLMQEPFGTERYKGAGTGYTLTEHSLLAIARRLNMPSSLLEQIQSECLTCGIVLIQLGDAHTNSVLYAVLPLKSTSGKRRLPRDLSGYYFKGIEWDRQKLAEEYFRVVNKHMTTEHELK